MSSRGVNKGVDTIYLSVVAGINKIEQEGGGYYPVFPFILHTSQVVVNRIMSPHFPHIFHVPTFSRQYLAQRNEQAKKSISTNAPAYPPFALVFFKGWGRLEIHKYRCQETFHLVWDSLHNLRLPKGLFRRLLQEN